MINGGSKSRFSYYCPNVEYAHGAKKMRDTTLDDENALQHVTCVVVTALDNQPEALASDLGNDQSRYRYDKEYFNS